MSTSRLPSDPCLHVDMGAQYISRFQSDCMHVDKSPSLGAADNLYQELTTECIPFNGQIEGEMKPVDCALPANYVVPGGMSSLCKYFLEQSKSKILYHHNLSHVDLSSNADGKKKLVLCQTESNGHSAFDAVILTLPVPQLLQIEGDLISSLEPQLKATLASVKYSSRYALGLFYDADKVLSSPRSFDCSWTAKYFDDPVIRFACWDNVKRGCTKVGRTLLIHTSVPFGLKHLEEEKGKVESLILQTLSKLIPGLPQHTYTHIICWRFSQVHNMFPGLHDSVVLSHDPLVIATGDSFTGSNFNNCIRAALSTVESCREYSQ